MFRGNEQKSDVYDVRSGAVLPLLTIERIKKIREDSKVLITVDPALLSAESTG